MDKCWDCRKEIPNGDFRCAFHMKPENREENRKTTFSMKDKYDFSGITSYKDLKRNR